VTNTENVPVWGLRDAAKFIRVPSVTDDKYRHGVLGVVTGSKLYSGAAVLGVEAAHRTGIGMVRYLGPGSAQQLVLARRPEVVTVPGQVQAWLIGSGMDASQRTAPELARLRLVLDSGQPVVVDAGALDLATSAAGPVVITPHARELARLLLAHAKADAALSLPTASEAALADVIAADPASWSERAADALGVAILLKGNITHVSSPAQAHGARFHVQIPAPTTWLATAGSGDVLAGILGALLATSAASAVGQLRASGTLERLAQLAATAAFLHGSAAELTSAGGPIAALDIAEAVPAAIVAILG
jgi:NAD(P)H-hydrate repair Nnr-like enzyme with NAD(P)H-hydrate dehydratase domain